MSCVKVVSQYHAVHAPLLTKFNKTEKCIFLSPGVEHCMTVACVRETKTMSYNNYYQERIIKRGGGRACNFCRFGTGQNNPPVLFIERSFAREKLIAWHDAFVSAYARVRVQILAGAQAF